MAIVWNNDRHELWKDGEKQFQLIPANYKVIQPTPVSTVELVIKTAGDGNLSGYHIGIHLWNESPLQPGEDIDYILWLGPSSKNIPDNWWELGRAEK